MGRSVAADQLSNHEEHKGFLRMAKQKYVNLPPLVQRIIEMVVLAFIIGGFTWWRDTSTEIVKMQNAIEGLQAAVARIERRLDE